MGWEGRGQYFVRRLIADCDGFKIEEANKLNGVITWCISLNFDKEELCEIHRILCFVFFLRSQQLNVTVSIQQFPT